MTCHPNKKLLQCSTFRRRIPLMGILLVISLVSTSVAADRPNIVIILADDLGYGSLNSYGADESHIQTPNIDRLAEQGRRFTDANTPSSVCSPTRYGLLTGRTTGGRIRSTACQHHRPAAYRHVAFNDRFAAEVGWIPHSCDREVASRVRHNEGRFHETANARAAGHWLRLSLCCAAEPRRRFGDLRPQSASRRLAQ